MQVSLVVCFRSQPYNVTTPGQSGAPSRKGGAQPCPSCVLPMPFGLVSSPKNPHPCKMCRSTSSSFGKLGKPTQQLSKDFRPPHKTPEFCPGPVFSGGFLGRRVPWPKATREVLRGAKEAADRVAIVTLSARPWVFESADQYLPGPGGVEWWSGVGWGGGGVGWGWGGVGHFKVARVFRRSTLRCPEIPEDAACEVPESCPEVAMEQLKRRAFQVGLSAEPKYTTFDWLTDAR